MLLFSPSRPFGTHYRTFGSNSCRDSSFWTVLTRFLPEKWLSEAYSQSTTMVTRPPSSRLSFPLLCSLILCILTETFVVHVKPFDAPYYSVLCLSFAGAWKKCLFRNTAGLSKMLLTSLHFLFPCWHTILSTEPQLCSV